MTLVLILFGAVLWIECGRRSYVMTKRYYDAKSAAWIAKWGTDDSAYRWTVDERNSNLFFSIFGPISLFATWTTYQQPREIKDQPLSKW